MSKRTPDADAFGHCRVCGKVADHVHNEIPLEDTSPPPEPDMVIMVELEPEMVAAFAEAEAAEAQDEVFIDLPAPDETRRVPKPRARKK